MSEDGKQEQGRGDLPAYHVYSVPVQAPANVPVYPVYETAEPNSRGDGKSVVNYEQKLGRTRGVTTCTSCQQQVMTNITYEVGRFAKQMCVLYGVLGFLAFVIPMLLLLLPLYVKDFKDVHHTCPLCYRELHIEKKRWRECWT